MNLSKVKRQEMLNFLEHLKAEHTDDETLRAINEIENTLTEKKYGLVWEEHSEKVDKMLEHNIPIFIEQEDKKIVSSMGESFNFLLEGDNLHSLKLLEKTHKECIDVIYIDPPYNTGEKDFIYDDNYIQKDDGYKHSKWLSFMSKRLEIGKKLLSSEGVIFISIGDDELCNLKLLCDEIFGENNYVNTISVNMKNIAGASGGGEDKKFKKNLEYLLIYAKDYISMPLFNSSYNFIELYTLIENMREEGRSWKYTSVLVEPGEKEYLTSTVDGSGDEIKIYKRIDPVFKSVKQMAKIDGITEKEAYYKYIDKIFRTTMPQSSIRPRVQEKVIEVGKDNDFYSIEYVPKSGKNKGVLYEQFYKGDAFNLLAWLSDVVDINEDGIYKKELNGTYWNHVAGTKNLTKEGSVKFKNGKKPLDLLKEVIFLYPSTEAIFLDFFAGSGTTGHAVAALNKEDGGNRKYILCTNNENNICEEVTYERIKNIQEELPHNLKYMRTDFIPKLLDDNISIKEKMIENIIPLIELEYGVEVDGLKNIFVLDEEKVEGILAGADNNVNIFIGSDILLSQKEKTLAKQKSIRIVEIPEYYYRNELREVGEI